MIAESTDVVDALSCFEYNDGQNDLFEDNDLDTGDVEKVEKGRERNREHAKRTRLRKKAVLEGMKGKLMELQNEASKLEQSFEETNTANILLRLCSKATSHDNVREESTTLDGIKSEPGFDPSVKGNIIQQLRTKVRSEAAQKCQELAAQVRSRNSSISISDPPSALSSFAAYAEAVHLETDCDSDNEDFDAYQPLLKNTVNWKNGTVVSEEGGERKLTEEEMEHLRKERNRVHAKLTRDRKKLFTSRMQQMINSLERQNLMMKGRLKSLVGTGDQLDPSKLVSSGTDILSKLQELPRQMADSNQFHNKFSSGFSATLLQALNTNNLDFSDRSGFDARFCNSSPEHGSDTNFTQKPFFCMKEAKTGNSNDKSSFSRGLGPLSRIQLTTSNSHSNATSTSTSTSTSIPSSYFNNDGQSAHFTSSASPSFLEAFDSLLIFGAALSRSRRCRTTSRDVVFSLQLAKYSSDLAD